MAEPEKSFWDRNKGLIITVGVVVIALIILQIVLAFVAPQLFATVFSRSTVSSQRDVQSTVGQDTTVEVVSPGDQEVVISRKEGM